MNRSSALLDVVANMVELNRSFFKTNRKRGPNFELLLEILLLTIETADHATCDLVVSGKLVFFLSSTYINV